MLFSVFWSLFKSIQDVGWALWSHFVGFVFTFLKQASSSSRCLRECCNSVFLWSSRNILWPAKLHLRQHEDGGDIDRVFVNWSRAKTKNCESYFLRPLTSACCFLLTGVTVWTRAKDVIWTSISRSWCDQSSTEDKLHWPCYFFYGQMFRGWFRRRSFTCKHIALCRHFTHVSFGQIHIRCCRRFVFNILTFLLRSNWTTTAALISPSITPQSVTLPLHAVCVQVWLFLHFRAEKSPFFECSCSEKEKG